VVREGNKVHVYMTASVRTSRRTTSRASSLGDEVYFHVTNLEQDWDVPHGFAVKGATNAETAHHARRDLHPEMETPSRVGVAPFYCTDFCSALHQEMQGYMRVSPALIGCGLIAALIGRRWALGGWLFTLFAFVIWAMWDMYSWGYKYGHDLDPHAAIQIEGMAYQPPLFGHKTLLNFEAWSFPDIGGYVLFGSIAIGVLVFLYEWRKNRQPAVATA
jgi:hypothetical protein